MFMIYGVWGCSERWEARTLGRQDARTPGRQEAWTLERWEAEQHRAPVLPPGILAFQHPSFFGGTQEGRKVVKAGAGLPFILLDAVNRK